MYYPLTAPDGKIIYPIAPEGYESRWRCGEKRYKEMVTENLVEWQLNTKDAKPVWQVYQKFYLEGRKKQPGNLWDSLEGNKKATRACYDVWLSKEKIRESMMEAKAR